MVTEALAVRKANEDRAAASNAIKVLHKSVDLPDVLRWRSPSGMVKREGRSVGACLLYSYSGALKESA